MSQTLVGGLQPRACGRLGSCFIECVLGKADPCQFRPSSADIPDFLPSSLNLGICSGLAFGEPRRLERLFSVGRASWVTSVGNDKGSRPLPGPGPTQHRRLSSSHYPNVGGGSVGAAWT